MARCKVVLLICLKTINREKKNCSHLYFKFNLIGFILAISNDFVVCTLEKSLQHLGICEGYVKSSSQKKKKVQSWNLSKKRNLKNLAQANNNWATKFTGPSFQVCLNKNDRLCFSNSLRKIIAQFYYNFIKPTYKYKQSTNLYTKKVVVPLIILSLLLVSKPKKHPSSSGYWLCTLKIYQNQELEEPMHIETTKYFVFYQCMHW